MQIFQLYLLVELKLVNLYVVVHMVGVLSCIGHLSLPVLHPVTPLLTASVH